MEARQEENDRRWNGHYESDAVYTNHAATYKDKYDEEGEYIGRVMTRKEHLFMTTVNTRTYMGVKRLYGTQGHHRDNGNWPMDKGVKFKTRDLKWLPVNEQEGRSLSNSFGS